MKHFYLKFNHGVEIGARLAYLGHYRRTGDKRVEEIADEEMRHMITLHEILEFYGEESSQAIDLFFLIVGTAIRVMCLISPRFLLNFVASSMETFAIFSYGYLSIVYPDFEYIFREMATAEYKHEKYFKEMK